jgi:hypothetical protein
MPTKPTKRRNPKRPARPPGATASVPAGRASSLAPAEPPRMLDEITCSRVLQLIDLIHADLGEIRARLDRIESKRPR